MKTHDDHYRLGFTLNAVIGQGNTRVTLIQLAMAYAAIANGGTLYVPQLVQAVEAPDGSVLEEFPPRVRRRIDVDPQHLTLRDRRHVRRGQRHEGHGVRGAHRRRRSGRGQDRHRAGLDRPAARRRRRDQRLVLPA